MARKRPVLPANLVFIVDRELNAVGSIKRIFEEYPDLEKVLPAMGYSDQQIQDLEETIRNADCDVVVSGTPHDISRLIDVSVPIVRVRYELEEKDVTLDTVLDRHADKLSL